MRAELGVCHLLGCGSPGAVRFAFGLAKVVLTLCLQILIGTIRDEVASCSEKTYGSIPIANAKNLLFLDSEGSVMEFARSKAWQVKDGRVHFPEVETGMGENDILATSGQVIENALGYARELETIV